MENLLETTVKKIILDPLKHQMKTDIDTDTVDPGTLDGGKIAGIIGNAVSNSGLPLNITFTESSTKENLEE